MRKVLSLLIIALGVCVGVPAEARPRFGSSEDFVTPARLRGRVDFWKDVFSKYGKDEVVIHHRRYPAVRFKVLDFREAAQQMSATALEALKKRVVDDRTAEVKNIIERCSAGERSAGEFAATVLSALTLMPGNISLREKCRLTIAEDWIRSQTGIRERYQEAVERSGRYLPHIERIFVEEFRLPVELTRLPFVESSFDYKAYSSVGAAGIWQFMPRTARVFMAVNKAIDERRDPIVSSRAAAKYLTQAYAKLGTWPLAVTSYNHGIAGVASKVREAETTDLAAILEGPMPSLFGFASSNFYPELLAAIEIYDDLPRYFPGVRPESALRFTTVKVSKAIGLRALAAQHGVSVDELVRFNYAFSEKVVRGVVPVPAGYSVKIPLQRGSVAATSSIDTQKVAVETQPPLSVPGGVRYQVKKGDTLLAIANRFGTTTKEIRAHNGLAPKSGIAIGQELIIPRRSAAEKTAAKMREYKVRAGDSWWSIAKRLDLSVAELKAANKSIGAKGLKPGQTLAVPRG